MKYLKLLLTHLLWPHSFPFAHIKLCNTIPSIPSTTTACFAAHYAIRVSFPPYLFVHKGSVPSSTPATVQSSTLATHPNLTYQPQIPTPEQLAIMLSYTYNEKSGVHVSTPSAIHTMGKVQSIPKHETRLRHIWIITGPAGCGKSSVADFLAKRLNLPYIEGDDVSFPPLLSTIQGFHKLTI